MIKSINRYAGLGMRIALLLLFFLLARSLLIPIVMGGLMAVLLTPLSRGMGTRMGRWRGYAPFVVTSGTLLLVLLPLVFIVTQAFLAGSDLLDRKDLFQSFNKMSNGLMRDMDNFTRPLHIKALDAKALADNLGPKVANGTASFISATAAAIPLYVVHALLFTVALFYFLRDGDRLLRWIRVTSPFSPTETEELFVAVDGTVRGAILGTFAVAIVQGGLTLTALLVLGVPGAFLWGVVAALFSLLPIVGTIPVTMGAVAYFFITGDPTRAVIMGVVALVIGTSDNIVRPWVQSAADGMHPLLALLAIFGGLELFGPFGVFLGPVAVSMALWALDTYGALRGEGSGHAHSSLIVAPHEHRSEIVLPHDRRP